VALKPIDELGPLGQAKREQILMAARKLFLEAGFERTSMEAIREMANVSKPTLYNHYQSKEALFAAVVSQAVDRIAGEWVQLIVTDTIAPTNQEELRATLTRFAHQGIRGLMHSEYLALLRVVVAEMPRFPQLPDVFRVAGPERGIQLAATLLGHVHARGLISVADSDMAARVFIGPLLSYVLLDGLLVSGEPQLPAPERIEVMIDLVMKALV
jgi:AcrR family transcriptional regulator